MGDAGIRRCISVADSGNIYIWLGDRSLRIIPVNVRNGLVLAQALFFLRENYKVYYEKQFVKEVFIYGRDY